MMDLTRATDVLSTLVHRRGSPEECRAYLAIVERLSPAGHEGVDRLVRDAVARERRIRELEADLAEADRRKDNMFQLANLLSADLSRARVRIAELERVAADLEALLAASGPEISHDDVARILRDALNKHAQDRTT